MFTTDDIKQGVQFLREHGARRIILFGSAKDDPATANDLDFAVSGITPAEQWRLASELEKLMQRRIDLVDLDEDTYIARHVERFGRVMYER